MKELEILIDRLKEADEKFPALRREVIEDIGKKALAAVTGHLGDSDKIAKWQDVHIGSRGGYAAIRPKARTWDKYHRAAGAVTTAVEYGHKPGYHQTQPVPGKFFYRAAEPEVTALSEQASARLAEKLHDILEG